MSENPDNDLSSPVASSSEGRPEKVSPQSLPFPALPKPLSGGQGGKDGAVHVPGEEGEAELQRGETQLETDRSHMANEEVCRWKIDAFYTEPSKC